MFFSYAYRLAFNVVKRFGIPNLMYELVAVLMVGVTVSNLVIVWVT